tara:strand:+ start:127 stop:405 length:279 start_codon:yes stop_codon:yes gene_type:complete
MSEKTTQELSTETTTETTPKSVEVHPLQILVNAVTVAHKRGAFSLDEAALIARAVNCFKPKEEPSTETTEETSAETSTDASESSEDSEVKEI